MTSGSTSDLHHETLSPAENQAQELLDMILERIKRPGEFNSVDNLALLYLYANERLKWVMWRSRNPRRAGLMLAREIEALTFKLIGINIR